MIFKSQHTNTQNCRVAFGAMIVLRGRGFNKTFHPGILDLHQPLYPGAMETGEVTGEVTPMPLS